MRKSHAKNWSTVQAHKRHVKGQKRAIEVKKHARYVGAYQTTRNNHSRTGEGPRKKFFGLF